MIKAVMTNTDEAYPEDRAEIEGRTIIVLALSESGISINASGFVTDSLLDALKKDFPKVITRLKKEIK